MAERLARVLSCLGADSDLLNADTEGILDLIDEYWADNSDSIEEGKVAPSFHWFIH